ncbi:MAG: hypothetical protein J0I48_16125 [Devosia sp.]|uniref:hypothetical protein n=1 Tax=Devosia sp. 66-22 TaxID=1895753 RepID=UPI000927ACF1|nr:hypothetical protein [Devosia sp. 66-22]MBN9347698.1 hypothetical protein [Devosia sp.]OJX51223.1 MAG: hypothetical protein BGO81_11075 [Devosia sp. 66-22]
MRFTKVSANVWRSARFKKLDDPARLFYLFLISNEHANSIGAYRLPDGYALDDLGSSWTAPKLTKARDALLEAELIAFDAEAQTYFVRRWFKHSPPQNESHAQGCRRLISELESDAIREAVEVEFEEANAQRPSPSPLDYGIAASGSRGSDKWPVRLRANGGR